MFDDTSKEKITTKPIHVYFLSKNTLKHFSTARLAFNIFWYNYFKNHAVFGIVKWLKPKMADQVSYRTPFRATSTSVNADLKSTAKYSLPTFAFALRAFLLVSFISSQLVLCNVTVATISPFISESENKSINISEFALISSTTTSTTTSAYSKLFLAFEMAWKIITHN